MGERHEEEGDALLLPIAVDRRVEQHEHIGEEKAPPPVIATVAADRLIGLQAGQSPALPPPPAVNPRVEQLELIEEEEEEVPPPANVAVAADLLIRLQGRQSRVDGSMKSAPPAAEADQMGLFLFLDRPIDSEPPVSPVLLLSEPKILDRPIDSEPPVFPVLLLSEPKILDRPIDSELPVSPVLLLSEPKILDRPIDSEPLVSPVLLLSEPKILDRPIDSEPSVSPVLLLSEPKMGFRQLLGSLDQEPAPADRPVVQLRGGDAVVEVPVAHGADRLVGLLIFGDKGGDLLVILQLSPAGADRLVGLLFGGDAANDSRVTHAQCEL